MRHFASTADAARCVGQLDIPLSAAGLTQAQAFARQLRWQPDALICSDLLRAQQSAAPVAQRLGLTVVLDRRLRELDMGRFTGELWDQIHARHPQALAHWGENFVNQGPPGGESFIQLRARAVGAFNAALHLGESPLLVAHAGTIRALLAAAKNYEASAAMHIPIAYGQCVEFAPDLLLP